MGIYLTKKHIGIGVAIILACISIFFVTEFLPHGGSYPEAKTISVGIQGFDELSERFAILAQEKGGAYAFEVLRRAQLPPQTDLHLLGHVVGDELYLQEGTAGIALCTNDFRNACSHAIVVGTLTEKGAGSLDDIRDACHQAPGGGGAYTMCYHGLGHGVFSFFGYEIPDTVDFCRKTGTEAYNNREYVECVGGAIMELMGGGGHDPELWEQSREKYLREPLAPCMNDDIPDDVKEICIIYITPQIWESVGISLGRPEPEKFRDAFKICDSIPQIQQNLRDACFGGFGKEFVPIAGSRDIRKVSDFTDTQFIQAINWCALAGVEDGERACISDAVASVFWGGENDPDAAFRFCSLVQVGPIQDSCFSRLAVDIRSFVTEPTRKQELCSRIPESMQQQCL